MEQTSIYWASVLIILQWPFEGPKAPLVASPSPVARQVLCASPPSFCLWPSPARGVSDLLLYVGFPHICVLNLVVVSNVSHVCLMLWPARRTWRVEEILFLRNSTLLEQFTSRYGWFPKATLGQGTKPSSSIRPHSDNCTRAKRYKWRTPCVPI